MTVITVRQLVLVHSSVKAICTVTNDSDSFRSPSSRIGSLCGQGTTTMYIAESNTLTGTTWRIIGRVLTEQELPGRNSSQDIACAGTPVSGTPVVAISCGGPTDVHFVSHELTNANARIALGVDDCIRESLGIPSESLPMNGDDGMHAFAESPGGVPHA